MSTTFTGREQDLRSLITQLDKFTAYLNDQKDDIIAAFDSLNNLVGQVAEQKPVLDKALKTIPDAITVLKDERTKFANTLGRVDDLGNSAADMLEPSKENLIKELGDLGPVEKSLADSGLALTRGLDYLAVPLFSKPTLAKSIRFHYGNIPAYSFDAESA